MNKLTYSAPEVAQLLGISRSAAYNLMHRDDFPSFRIGKRWLVRTAACMNGWKNRVNSNNGTAYWTADMV